MICDFSECVMFQALFEGVVTAAENGGKKVPFQTQLGYTKDQIEAIQRLKNAKGDYERLGLRDGASKYLNSFHVLCCISRLIQILFLSLHLFLYCALICWLA